jgi:hypothetical protein
VIENQQPTLRASTAGISYVTVDSSSIARIGFDPSTATLAICFHNGAEYHYLSVPEHHFSAMAAAPSVGAYFHQQVRNAGFDYRCIREPEA